MKAITERDGDVTEIYHKDPHDDKFHVQIVQDVSQYLRVNQHERHQTERGTPYSNKSAFHKVASIPEVVIAQWWKELGSNPLAKENRRWLVAKLNSNEFKKLRTREGQI